MSYSGSFTLRTPDGEEIEAVGKLATSGQGWGGTATTDSPDALSIQGAARLHLPGGAEGDVQVQRETHRRGAPVKLTLVGEGPAPF